MLTASENLDELVSAAGASSRRKVSAVTPSSLPVDEHRPGVDAKSRAGRIPMRPLNEPLPPRVDAATGETLRLAAFLTHAALEAGDNQAQAGQDAVQLMTVHAGRAWSSTPCSSPGWRKGCFDENALSATLMADWRRATPDVRGHHARGSACT